MIFERIHLSTLEKEAQGVGLKAEEFLRHVLPAAHSDHPAIPAWLTQEESKESQIKAIIPAWTQDSSLAKAWRATIAKE